MTLGISSSSVHTQSKNGSEKMACFKLSLLLKKQGRHGEQQVDSLMRNKSNNVNEEYMEAFRTNSFIEICSKVKSKWGSSKSIHRLSSSPSLLPRDLHVSQCLLHPSQSAPAEIPGDEICQLLSVFFSVSSEACKIFESILTSIYQTRSSYNSMGRVLEQLRRVSDEDQRNELYRNLASFALLANPLATISEVQFQDFRDNLYLSLQQLTSQGKRMRRRRKLVQCCKKVAGGTLIVSCCALAIAVLFLTVHCAVGILALPGLAASSLGMFLKRLKKTKQGLSDTTYMRRYEDQLDTAARGIYLLMNDFDTMSRIMTMLGNEIEHSKFTADLLLRRRCNKMLMEVAKDYRINRNGVMNQLEELEDHVYLCILNINRSRRLLTQAMVVI